MWNVKVFPFSPIEENTYLLYNGSGQGIIVDPGCYDQRERDVLDAFIQSQQIQPVLLLNTHCHLDHVFGNKHVAERYGLVLHLHPKEQPMLDWAPAAALMWGLPFDNYSGELQFLEPGKSLFSGEETLSVLFTPGHSPGSISLYSEAGAFVISGDVLFRQSIGRTDLPGGDLKVLEKSIREVLYRLPDSTTVYSGHGPTTTIGFEKANNPFVPI